MNTNILKNITINKHNALTDGYIPKTGKEILPDKLINALYLRYEQEGTKFTITKIELRELLGLKSSKDNERIEKALTLLATAIQVRDYVYEGREVAWAAISFLNNPKRYKDGTGYELTINEEMVEVLKQKIGYTPIEIEVINQFRTKYALKLYELYKRFYSLPNNKGEGVGTIAKNLEELNNMFSTTFKAPSQMLRSIERGLNEIEKKTGILMTCFYDKRQKAFIFGWHQEVMYPDLRIPYKRIDELISWYISKQNPIINNLKKYRENLKQKIINDEFGDLDAHYRGMLQWKYGLTPDQIRGKEYYNARTGKYKNFTRKEQPSLV